MTLKINPLSGSGGSSITALTASVIDNNGTPGSGDGLVRLSLSVNTKVSSLVITATTQIEVAFISFGSFEALLPTPGYAFNSGNLLFNSATITTQPTLRYIPAGSVFTNANYGQFCYNGGGAGNHSYFETSSGSKFPVFDLGTAANDWPAVRTDLDSISINVSENIVSRQYVASGDNKDAILINTNNGVGLIDLYFDRTVGTATERIVQSGGDITILANDLLGQGKNPFDEFWLPVYVDESASAENRFKHNGGGGQVPADIYVSIPIGNKSLKIAYDSNAGILPELYWSRNNSRFEANLSANTTVSTSTLRRPDQEV